MKTDATTFDWTQARSFLAVCEEGTLSAAARALGLTQPTIGRQITAFEQALGVTLFERAGHSLRLTDTGAHMQVHIRAMADAAARASLAATRQSTRIAGHVRITAGDLFTAHIVAPLLHQIRAGAPALQIDIVASNDISNLLEREADIALRHVRPKEPDLVARLVHTAKADFYAATAYLDARGRPRRISDMTGHDFVSFGDTSEMLGHLAPLGLDLSAEHFKVGSANGLVAWEMVKQGHGISIMSRDVGQNTPGVERVLPAMEPVAFPVWLVTHREVHTARRIRHVYDQLADALPRMMT